MTKFNLEINDKIQGSMLSGAIGDALGYPVEFMSYEDMCKTYGYTNFHTMWKEVIGNNIAKISDDTQMTMFTANGLINTIINAVLLEQRNFVQNVYNAYLDWLNTQTKIYNPDEYSNYLYMNCWIITIKELWSRRAPGNTCLNSLQSGKIGTIEHPLNNSKGCGGVMRVAPVGLYLGRYFKDLNDITRLGSNIAAITHGHVLGYVPAGMLANMIADIVYNNDELINAVYKSIDSIKNIYKGKEVEDLVKLIEFAIMLSHNNIDDIDAIRRLGQGWTGDEALAIAIYCSLKYKDDIYNGLYAAINHDGDSDSTGAITGNILGAKLGTKVLYNKYIENLELADTIVELANDMSVDLMNISNRYCPQF